MHIIQIQTIEKGARERSGIPWSCYLVIYHAFYKEWANISRKCVASPCLGKKLRMFVLCRHARHHKSNHHLGNFMVLRGISKIEGAGNPNFLPSSSFSFFYNQHTPLNAMCSNLAFFRAHLPY